MEFKKRKLNIDKNYNNKKFKVNENIQEDYKDIDLEKYKRAANEEIYFLSEKVTFLREHIKEVNCLISKKCLDKNGKHEWKSEREEGLYGERYTFCKHCKVDAYDNRYLHY